MNFFTALATLPKIYQLITASIELISEAEKAYQDKTITVEERNKVIEKIYPIRDNILPLVSNSVIQSLVDVLVALLNAAGLFLNKK